MTAADPLALAARLPDEPRWVDFRGVLLSRCGGAWADEEGWAAVAADRGLAVVVGRPGDRILEEISRAPVVLVPLESASDFAGRLGAGEWGEAVLNARASSTPSPRPLSREAGEAQPSISREIEVRVVLPDEPFSAPDFGAELEREWAASRAAGWPLAVAFDGDRPVALTYSAFETEGYWDVSVDTLEPYRRRGLAAATFELLAAEMARAGKAPVWGAEVDNEASLRLAVRLGFSPAGRLMVFERGESA